MLFLKKKILLLMFMVIGGTVSAQCYNFAKDVGISKLGDYVHDGNYNATILSEGENAEMYKTFFEGQRYRICISKIESLPSIHFKLVDRSGNILFDNQEHDFVLSWDFEVKTTQMLIVEMEVLKRETTENITSGCVAVLFGVQSDQTQSL